MTVVIPRRRPYQRIASDSGSGAIPQWLKKASVTALPTVPAAPRPTTHGFSLGERSGFSTTSQRHAQGGTSGGNGAPGSTATSVILLTVFSALTGRPLSHRT